MNQRTIVFAIAAIAIVGFGVASLLYQRAAPDQTAAVSVQESNTLVRPHSPIMGRVDAPVTIVEFFDPSCETCRAMYPHVKKLLADYPNDIRVVIRYAPFHKGSDEAVRILESARKQKKWAEVKEALLAAQPVWADHGQPRLDLAWAAAAQAGLDVEAARKVMNAAEITNVLTQDMADIRATGVRQTPTFLVNGKSLPSFGVRQLQELVRSEVEVSRRK